VLASNVASSIIDSAVFLTLAFGGAPEVRTVVGMTIGKFAASLVTFAAIAFAVLLRAPRPEPDPSQPERTRDGGRVAT